MPGVYLAGIMTGIAVGVIVYFFAHYMRKKILLASIKKSLYLIRIPRRGAKDKPADMKEEIGLSEQLFANLLSLRVPFVLEIAVPHVGEEIHFFLSVPSHVGEIAVKQVQSIWSGASVEPRTDDYNIFNGQGATVAAHIKQHEHFALPVRTYAEIGADTFESIVGAFSKINEIGEGAALQIIVDKPPQSAKRTIAKAIEALKKGEPLKKALSGGATADISGVRDTFYPKTDADKRKERTDRIVDDDAVKALEMKLAKPLFTVNVRLVASAPSPFQANDILDGLIAGFSQLAAPLRNELRAVKAKNPKKLIYEYIFRNFNASQAMVLTSEEIASFFHLPTSGTETPRVKWLKAKEAPPPPNLPAQGIKIGESRFRGQSKPVYLGDEDRRRHMYIIGQTGTGKSTLLGNMLLADIMQGKGVALIDPHGDLVETALSHIPRERVDDLILFDPSDLWKPLGLNMLDYNPSRPEEKTFIVNEMQSIFNKLFPPESMGPMFEQYMRNALLLLMEDMENEPASLIEVPRVFTDVEYRKRKLARIGNPVVVDFWQKEAAKAGGEASLANMTPYITSKFNNFIANDYMRPIIGQTKSAFNFRSIMDEQKILLVNLSKGRIGDINAGLLGMVFTGKILMAALSRVDMEQGERKDFNLYIDEFQNFTTDSISTILSEARKYRLSLVMAHQFIAQLTDKIKDAVFGNVGSEVVFRVGVQDAEFLAKQFEPVFDMNDLINIDNLNAYAKILINGETSKPFNMKIGGESWTKGDKAIVDALKEYSREKYGMDRETVEREIFRRLRE